jgi:alanyl aminopeptidase
VETRPKYATFIRNLYGPIARKLGWHSRPEDDENTRLLRKELLLFVVQKGEDDELAAQAAELIQRWFGDRKAIEPDMVSTVLNCAARNGDEALFNLYLQEAKKSEDPEERWRILTSMASFENPEIAKKALGVIVSKSFDIRESLDIAESMIDDPVHSNLVYNFATTNFDAIAARIPRDSVPYLAFFGEVFCDDQHQKEVESFFKGRTTRVPGGKRILDQTLEEIHLCSSFRKEQEPSFSNFFQSYK